MMSPVAVAAFTLWCGWAQPGIDAQTCIAAQATTVELGKTSRPTAVGNSWPAQRRVVLSDALTTDWIIASVLAHELTEVAAGPMPAGHDCGAYEAAGYRAQLDFTLWYLRDGYAGQPLHGLDLRVYETTLGLQDKGTDAARWPC